MSTNRLIVLAAAAALVAWSTAPALARSPGASHGSAGGSLGLGASPTRDGADAKASVKTDEKATPHRHDSKLNEHTNRGGELLKGSTAPTRPRARTASRVVTTR